MKQFLQIIYMNETFEGKKSPDRSRNTWEEGCQSIARGQKLEKMADRTGHWGMKLGEARARFGLQCHYID